MEGQKLKKRLCLNLDGAGQVRFSGLCKGQDLALTSTDGVHASGGLHEANANDTGSIQYRQNWSRHGYG
jgi:hypothetical protein